MSETTPARVRRPVAVRVVHACGSISAMAYVAATLLSWLISRHVPFGTAQSPGGIGFVPALASLRSTFLDPAAFLAAYSAPLLLASLSAIVLLIVLARSKYVDVAAADMVFRWALVLAGVTLVAYPVLVHDFWLSAVWGRMAAVGMNPYEQTAPEAILHAFPVEKIDPQMTYGPLWAVISATVMFCAGDSPVAAWLLFKLVLGAAWIGALVLVRELLRERPARYRAFGLVMFGWLPTSVSLSLGDGHNDIAMVVFMLAWLYALQRNQGLKGRLLLAAATLCKYVTAPLFLLDLLLHFRTFGWKKWAGYLRNALVVAAAAVAVFAIFFRSPHFFSHALAMREWRFYEPVMALQAVRSLFGVNVWFLPLLVRYGLLLLALFCMIRYVALPTIPHFYSSILACLSAILFTQIGHVWPWFVIWVLACAALIPERLMSRWITGVALAAPFVMLIWVALPDAAPRYTFLWPALCFYAFSLIWMFAGARLPAESADTEHSAA